MLHRFEYDVKFELTKFHFRIGIYLYFGYVFMYQIMVGFLRAIKWCYARW